MPEPEDALATPSRSRTLDNKPVLFTAVDWTDEERLTAGLAH